MPIHNLGYREWNGQRESGGSRWRVIAGIGIRRAWQSTWLRRIAFVVWGPPLLYGIFIFAFEQTLSANGGDPRDFLGFAEGVLPGKDFEAVAPAIVAAREMAPEQTLTIVRPLVWKMVLLQLNRSQCLAMIIVIGLCAPSLISHDIRSRAFLLYFSRPLSRLQYIFGKFATIAAFLLLTCTLPQLLLYLVAVLLSPDISVIAYTWDLPLRCVISTGCMIIPASLLALMFSSLTIESRFATFGWFFVWIFGLAAFLMMLNIAGDTSEFVIRLGFLFVLFNDIAAWVLDAPTTLPHIESQLVFASVLTAFCFAVIFRKVSAPMNA